MRRAHFETFQGEDGDWYWRLVAANGETVADSEGYTRERDAKRAAIDLTGVAVEASFEKIEEVDE